MKPVPKSRQNDASKIRAITVTNNKTETVRKTTGAMVENKVKETATIVALMTKLRNSKVSKIVETSAVNKRTNVQIKRLHVLTLKPVQQPSKQSKMQNTHVQVRNASSSIRLLKKPWLKLTNARNQRKSLKKRLS